MATLTITLPDGLAPHNTDRANLDRVCLTPIGHGRVCGHTYAQHFGGGTCIAGHRPKRGETAPAATCPCLRFDGST